MALTPMNLYTKVKVLRGVPFDSNYRDVCDGYTNAGNQASTIMGTNRVKYSYENISPIRLQNVIRLPICADFLYDCNYIMWQNANFGSKWFYAWITGIDWININCCHVHYQIDIWNTWYFRGNSSTDTTRGWDLEDCFVEREHTTDDTIGANLIPENVELGDYLWRDDTFGGSREYYNTYVGNSYSGRTILTKEMYVCFVTTFEAREILWDNTFDGAMYGSIYSGLCYIALPPDNTNLKRFINKVITKFTDTEGIISVFMIPKNLIKEVVDQTYQAHKIDYYKTTELNVMSTPTTLYNYIPRNKKLLTYPYSFLRICTPDGLFNDLKYENFYIGQNILTNNVKLRLIESVTGTNLQSGIVPLNYDHRITNYDSMVNIQEYPQCTWNSNSFREWWANNKYNVGASVISNALSSFGNGVNALGSFGSASVGALSGSGGVSGGSITSGINSSVKGWQDQVAILNTLGNTYVQYKKPANARIGDNIDLTVQCGAHEFFYGQMCIRPEYAKIIDSYFDRFGYATLLTKKPRLHTRSSWNYVKTIGSHINSQYTSLDVVSEIEKIFDNGVTIWHNINNIGDYSQTNSIL